MAEDGKEEVVVGAGPPAAGLPDGDDRSPETMAEPESEASPQLTDEARAIVAELAGDAGPSPMSSARQRVAAAAARAKAERESHPSRLASEDALFQLQSTIDEAEGVVIALQPELRLKFDPATRTYSTYRVGLVKEEGNGSGSWAGTTGQAVEGEEEEEETATPMRAARGRWNSAAKEAREEREEREERGTGELEGGPMDEGECGGGEVHI